MKLSRRQKIFLEIAEAFDALDTYKTREQKKITEYGMCWAWLIIVGDFWLYEILGRALTDEERSRGYDRDPHYDEWRVNTCCLFAAMSDKDWDDMMEGL